MKRFLLLFSAVILGSLCVLTVPHLVHACSGSEIQLSVPIVGNNNCISNDAAQGGAIVVYLRLILKFMSGVIGAVILLMLVIAGIQYITSAGDPGQVKNAKNRIINAITALVLFLSAYAILSFIIPGGIF